jgi:hypothetical protein
MEVMLEDITNKCMNTAKPKKYLIFEQTGIQLTHIYPMLIIQFNRMSSILGLFYNLLKTQCTQNSQDFEAKSFVLADTSK